MSNTYRESSQPTITLRKGKTEIKVQNAASIIKKINEMYPNTDGSWPVNWNKYKRDLNDAEKVEMRTWMASAKEWFQKEMFGGVDDFEVVVTTTEPPEESGVTIGTSKEDNEFRSVPEVKHTLPSEPPLQPEPTIVKSTNRNAYEIRTDVLNMALEWVRDKQSNATEDDVINVAQKFYRFVENKR
jgi:hypothetical protein